jgi:hypothetical protein
MGHPVAEAQACFELPFQDFIAKMCRMNVTSGSWTRYFHLHGPVV